MSSVARRPVDDTAASLDGAGESPPRSVAIRSFVVFLLVAGALVMAAAAAVIVHGSRAAPARRAAAGVTMPRSAQYRDVVHQLLARRTPEPLVGLTVIGSGGDVTVLRAGPTDTHTFPSAYLNPNALSVIARSVGAITDETTTVQQLRLELVRRTGRLRWRLRGEQGGRVWRATIAPNGTGLRVVGR